MKRILLLSLSFLIAGFLVSCKKNQTGIVTSPSGLILRAEASAKSTQIQLIPSGANVEIIDANGPQEAIAGISAKWYKIKYAGKEGWAFGGFISINYEPNADNSQFLATMAKIDEWNTRSGDYSGRTIIFGTSTYIEYSAEIGMKGRPKSGTYIIKGNQIFLDGNTTKPEFTFTGSLLQATKERYTIRINGLTGEGVENGRGVYVGYGVSTPAERDLKIQQLRNTIK